MQAKQVGVLDQGASGADGGIQRDGAADRALDQGASEADPGATDGKLTLTALHHMDANDDLFEAAHFCFFYSQNSV